MPTERILYTCKFCQTQGMVEWTPNPMFTLPTWQANIACNPCADFKTKRAKAIDKIVRLCTKLHQSREFDSEDLGSIETSIRSALVELTKRFARLVCDHNKIELVWDEDFIDQMFNKPDRAFGHLRFFERNLSLFAHKDAA